MAEQEILIVDDEPMVLRTLAQVFASRGYKTHVAEEGETALSLMQEHGLRVVFTDLRMPGMDGMDLCRRARALDDGAQVFAISAYISAFPPEDFESAGFTGRFEKPFNFNDLLEAAHQAFVRLTAVATAVDDGRNRRRAARVILDTPMLVSVIGSRRDPSLRGKTFKCADSSVSFGGLLLGTDRMIEEGTDLQLHLGVEGRARPMLLEAVARWSRQCEGRCGDIADVCVGVEFLESSRDLEAWRTFLRGLVPEP